MKPKEYYNRKRIEQLERIIPHLERYYESVKQEVGQRVRLLSRLQEMKLEYQERVGKPYEPKKEAQR